MTIKILILGIVGVALVSLAALSVRKAHAYDDFNLNGRRTGLPALVGTLGAAEFNTATLIGGASVAYLYGTVGIYYTSLIFVFVFSIYAFTVAKPYRRLEISTIAEYFERRFPGPLSEPTRALASLITLTFTWIAPATYLAGLSVIVSVLLGVDPVPTVIAITVLCLVLALAAGFITALSFDVFAYALILVFVPILLGVGYVNAGGFGSLSSVFEPEFLSFAPVWDLPTYGFASVLTWGFQNVLLYLAAPWYGQRIFSARSESIAYRGMLINTVLITVLYACVALATMFSRVLMPDLESPERALPSLVLNYTSPLLQGLLLATLLLVGITTMIAIWNAAVSIVVNDLLRRYAFKDRDDAFYIWLSRGVFVALGGSTLVFALTFVGSILLVLTYVSVFTALLAFPILAGLYWRRFTTLAALLSMIVGVIYVSIALLLSLPYPLVSPVGVALSVVAGVGATLVRPAPDDEPEVARFYRVVRGEEPHSPIRDNAAAGQGGAHV